MLLEIVFNGLELIGLGIICLLLLLFWGAIALSKLRDWWKQFKLIKSKKSKVDATQLKIKWKKDSQ